MCAGLTLSEYMSSPAGSRLLRPVQLKCIKRFGHHELLRPYHKRSCPQHREQQRPSHPRRQQVAMHFFTVADIIDKMGAGVY